MIGVNKKDIENSILYFAKIFNRIENYKALIKENTTLDRLVELISYEIFINEYIPYSRFGYDYNYKLILEYAKELRENGFVKFKD